LPQASILRPDKVFTLNKDLVIRRAGRLYGLSFSHILGVICKYLGRPCCDATDTGGQSEFRGAAPVSRSPTTRRRLSAAAAALAFSEPAKSQETIKGIIETAYDHGADMIVTLCPLCQMNVEVYQDQINATCGTKLEMPVVYYSTLLAVAYGRSAKDAALNGQVNRAKKLEKLAGK